MVDLVTLLMLEKRLVYLKIFTSFKMIKIECGSWFLRFVYQVDSSQLSLTVGFEKGALGTGPTVESTLFSAN